MHVWLLIIRLLLAAVFAVAALAKLADRAGSRSAVVGFGAPPRVAPVVAVLLPLGELVVAIVLLPASLARFGALGALVLLAGFAVAIARSMARGEAPDCHCFGQLHSAPAGWSTLARNLLLGGLAAFVAVAGWRDAGPSAVGWVAGLSDAGVVALASGAALVLLAGASAAFMLALLRQHGRLLLRIGELEARLDQAGVADAARPPTQPQHGLPVGALAPDFSLAGLYGETVTLEALTAADKPVLLLFTDPACGPCNALLPQVARWQGEHGGELTIAVITRGSADDNRASVREHGIAGVWLDTDHAVYEAYQVPGTPGAVLVDADGRIASSVRGGAPAIGALVADSLGRPLPIVRVDPGASVQPGPPRSGLALGAQAPSVDLRDLAGTRVRLTDQDRDTLVVFWNPACGFCQQMLDDLRAWEAAPQAGAPRLVLISTGTVEANQAMGLRAPIVLDQSLAVSASLDMSGTPSGVLVDRHGRIASQLAIGARGVMALGSTVLAGVRDPSGNDA